MTKFNPAISDDLRDKIGKALESVALFRALLDDDCDEAQAYDVLWMCAQGIDLELCAETPFPLVRRCAECEGEIAAYEPTWSICDGKVLLCRGCVK